jgi:hypothetical protein
VVLRVLPEFAKLGEMERVDGLVDGFIERDVALLTRAPLIDTGFYLSPNNYMRQYTTSDGEQTYHCQYEGHAGFRKRLEVLRILYAFVPLVLVEGHVHSLLNDFVLIQAFAWNIVDGISRCL